MPEFLVELYVSRADADGGERAACRARLAAEALTSEGTAVDCLSSILVPEDEICFLLYRAASVEVVRAAASRAALVLDRISPARPLKL
jgi:hypothetical protein